MIPASEGQQRNPLVYLNITIDGEKAGCIVIELRADIVPRTAENFRALCTGEKGMGVKNKPLHYKGVRFHKAISQFMVQGGDIVHGDGSDGESIYGPTFDDENFILMHDAGVLSMANQGRPHTNGSQFCITTVPCPHLDGTNVVFGRVLAGLGLVLEIQQHGDEIAGRPKVDCVIAECGEIKQTCSWRSWLTSSCAERLPEFPDDYPQAYTLPIDQLISSICEVKTSGNSCFGDGQYKAAARKYRKCLRYIDCIKARIRKANHQNHCTDITLTYTQQCQLNLATCYRKLEDYRSCISCCTEVLDTEPRNEKALYRRAQANFALKNYEAALNDLKFADKVCPNNRAVQKLLEEVRVSNKGYNDLQKQRLSKFFRDQKEKSAGIGDH